MGEKAGNIDLLQSGQEPDKGRTDPIEQLAIAESRARSRASPQPTRAKAPAARPAVELDPSRGTRSVDEIAERMGRVAEQGAAADRAVAAVRRTVRKAERTAGDGGEISGTGYTALKLRQKPIPRLIDTGKIGMEEIQAADEIAAAFEAVTSRLMVRGSWSALDRVDGGGAGNMPASARSAKQIARFQAWSDFWSRRHKLLADPMLEVVIAAVVDERAIREIAQDVERGADSVKRGIIAGLRDYAARAGFVSSSVRADAWLEAAVHAFPQPARLSSVLLRTAVNRARVER